MGRQRRTGKSQKNSLSPHPRSVRSRSQRSSRENLAQQPKRCVARVVQPDEPQMDLMRRTASHVARATNDAQLRARILAHHGADPRFAFLRGRWARAWALAQAGAHRALVTEQEAQKARALGGLTGYGSGSNSSNSGSEDDEEDKDEDGGDDVATERDRPAQVLGEEQASDVQVQLDQEAQPEPEELALRTAQEARRAKARQWAEKRRSDKALAFTTVQQTQD